MVRFGLSLFGSLDSNQMSSISAEAERAGFESVWIVEGTGTDAFVASTEIALNTSTIRIGTDIVSTFTRHPCVLASASASVDMVAKGRFRLGLGASHQSIVENQLGLSFTKPIKRMEETIQILTKIFASREPISFNGEIFAISNYSLWFRPFREHIDIYLAAGGPRMIDLLARQTDGSLFFLKTEDAVRKANRRISAISRELSKQPPDCGLIVPCAFHENVTKALNAARTTLAMYIVEYDVYRDLLLKQGFKEVDKIAAAGRSGLEDASKLVDDSMVGALTLCGTKYDIGKQMKKFEQAGVHLIVLEPCFFEGEKLSDTIHRTIELNG